MKKFIVEYYSGGSKLRTTVEAIDQAAAKRTFQSSHPGISPSSVQQA
jgi:hypothetical protein